jgi:hypothetical protein
MKWVMPESRQSPLKRTLLIFGLIRVTMAVGWTPPEWAEVEEVDSATAGDGKRVQQMIQGCWLCSDSTDSTDGRMYVDSFVSI